MKKIHYSTVLIERRRMRIAFESVFLGSVLCAVNGGTETLVKRVDMIDARNDDIFTSFDSNSVNICWCTLCRRRPWLQSQRAKVSVQFLHSEYIKNATAHCETVTMMNLPDEIMLGICSRMDMIDVLYSFIGVNERLSRLVRDPIFTQPIELIRRNNDGETYPLSNLVLDRFRRQILPTYIHLWNLSLLYQAMWKVVSRLVIIHG